MDDTTKKSEMTESVAAAKKYIGFRQEKCGWHKAHVLTPESEKVGCADLLKVLVEVSDNVAKVTIDWTGSHVQSCNNSFTSAESKFCVYGRSLQIKAADAIGCPITIEISAAE